MAIKSTTIAAEPTSRLLFIDNLRTGLITLVVLHHVALVYGAFAPFYYVEPPTNDPLAFQVLLVFGLINQSWFMGALFLLSGYFTPGSFDRKGPGSFLKDRLLRLGIPLIVFFGNAINAGLANRHQVSPVGKLVKSHQLTESNGLMV